MTVQGRAAVGRQGSVNIFMFLQSRLSESRALAPVWRDNWRATLKIETSGEIEIYLPGTICLSYKVVKQRPSLPFPREGLFTIQNKHMLFLCLISSLSLSSKFSEGRMGRWANNSYINPEFHSLGVPPLWCKPLRMHASATPWRIGAWGTDTSCSVRKVCSLTLRCHR